MKRTLISTLAGAFLLVNASSAAANTIGLGGEGDRDPLHSTDIMESYQKNRPTKCLKMVQNLSHG